jgi:hypothetical protein
MTADYCPKEFLNRCLCNRSCERVLARINLLGRERVARRCLIEFVSIGIYSRFKTSIPVALCGAIQASVHRL